MSQPIYTCPDTCLICAAPLDSSDECQTHGSFAAQLERLAEDRADAVVQRRIEN